MTKLAIMQVMMTIYTIMSVFTAVEGALLDEDTGWDI